MSTAAEKAAKVQTALAAAEAKAKADAAELRARKGEAAPVPMTLSGFGKAAASGLRSGVEAIPGMVGDVPELMGRGARWASEKTGVGDPEAAQAATQQAASSPLSSIVRTLQRMGVIGPDTNKNLQTVVQPTSRDIGEATDFAVKQLPDAASGPIQDVTRYQPQNPFEELTATTAAFAPTALLPGSLGARIARPFVIGGGVEGAGQATRQIAPEYEEAARLVAGVLLGHATGAGQPEFKFKTRAALDALKTNPEGLARMQEILQSQGMTPADVAGRMRELGLQAMPLDVGANLRQEGQQMMGRNTEGRPIIDEALRTREAGKNARVQSGVETVVGPEVQRTAVLEALKQRASELSPRYDEAHAAQQMPVETQGIVDAIDSELAKAKGKGKIAALKSIRDSLHLKDSGELDPSSEGLHEARKAIDEQLYDAKGNVREDLAPEVAGTLKHYRGLIDERLGEANPALKEVDVQRRQIGKEERAYKTGEKLYSTADKALSPTEFQGTWNAMNEGERARLLEGVNRETWKQLGIAGNDLVKLQSLLRGEGKWNHQKLATVIGEDKTSALMQMLENEKVKNETYNKVIQGSKTAESIGSKGSERPSLAGAVVNTAKDAALAFPFAGPTGIGTAALSNARQYLAGLMRGGAARGPSSVQDRGLANLLTSMDPDAIQKAVNAAQATGSPVPPMILNALLARQQQRNRQP